MLYLSNAPLISVIPITDFKMSKSVNSDSDFFSRFEQVVFLHSSPFQRVAKLHFFCTNVSHYFLKEKDFYVEKGLPLKSLFSKKIYIIR